MTNKKLKAALLKKIGITESGLSRRVRKIKEKHSMTTEDATYVIAQQEKIILDKYLDGETIDRVRSLMPNVSESVPQASARISQVQKGRKATGKKQERIVQIGKEFKGTDPILSTTKLNEAKEMAAVYPLLYVLENSMREFIHRFMTNKHGVNWWDSQASTTLKNIVASRMKDETKHSWHQRRGARPIDYLDLKDLPKLMRKIENEVSGKVIPDIQWFEQMVNEVYKSRCVVCHMNPLEKDSITSVSLRFKQWNKQVLAKISRIPAPSST